MSFDQKWEIDIYRKGKQINYYPFDNVVSDVSSIFKNLNVSKLNALDLGCGTGNNTKFLIDFGFKKVIGVDGSKAALLVAKKRIRSKKCQFLKTNFNNMKFKKNYFNLILDRGSLTHNNKDQIKKNIKKIHNSLKKNGFFISHMFNKKHTEFTKSTFFKKSMNLKKPINSSFFDKAEINKIFRSFKIISIRDSNRKELKTGYNESFWHLVCQKK
jgi:ubiquinone/menaquinone biosynthesis C-methylase UbiE